jgi:hypothetical protein
MTDDPTPGGRRDGLDPGEEHRTPDADRHHGGVKDPEHPDFFSTDHRYLPRDVEVQGQPERSLVVDDHASATAGAGSRTQAQLAGPPPSSPDDPRPDAPGDPRGRLPDAEPDAT